MKTISVIIPVYNVESYLRRCFDSILAQTYRDFELILVDDGSPDRCGEMCDEYAKKDPRIVVIHQKNGGLSAARNAGIEWALENSKSEYLAFIDSDDWILPKYLEELVRGIEMSDGISCVECQDVKSEQDAIEPMEMAWRVDTPREYWLTATYAMTAWGKLFKKGLFRNVRFPVGHIHEDEWTLPSVLFSNSKIAFCKTRLYCYFRRISSITGDGWTERSMVDIIAARKDQEAFFSQIGDEELVALARMRLCESYAAAVLHGHSEYKPFVRKMMRSLNFPILPHCNEYHAAYGRLGRICWSVAHIWDVYKRRGLVDAIRQYKKTRNL